MHSFGLGIECVYRLGNEARAEVSGGRGRGWSARCWTTRLPTPTGPVSELTGLALSRLNAIACTW